MAATNHTRQTTKALNRERANNRTMLYALQEVMACAESSNLSDPNLWLTIRAAIATATATAE